MDHQLLFVILVLFILVAAVSVLAERAQFPSPILMLLAGGALAFVPGVPAIRLDPDVVLLLLLPPLLYSGGVGMSWRGFRSNLRPILMLAVGCVLFTAASVAFVMHELLGTAWAVGFVLGAIVSPPDAVAALALLRSVRLPRRILTVLEGESLANDATALVILGIALQALTTGRFSLADATLRFLAIAVGEVAFGVALGWLALRARRVARAPRAEVLLALATPYVAFWPPHALGGSGVIACVAAGLYVSWNGRRLIPPDTRLQGYFIWDLVVWATESLVFLLGGLQARVVAEAVARIGWGHALAVGSLVTFTIVVVRFVWVFPATYVPRALVPSWHRGEPPADWRTPFVVAFAGIRGVDSLAAALLVPAVVNGSVFGARDLIVFSTYLVIGVTIVLLGAMLPALLRMLGLTHVGRLEAEANRRDEQKVRLEGVDAVIGFLKRAGAEGKRSVGWLCHAYDERRRALVEGIRPTPEDPATEAARLEREIVRIEREAVARAYDENRLTDEARRRIERELDLEEARIANRHANSARVS